MVNLFDTIDIHKSHAIIQLNITLSNFNEHKQTTLNLFTQEEDDKQSKLTVMMQKLREKYGIDIVKSGGEM